MRPMFKDEFAKLSLLAENSGGLGRQLRRLIFALFGACWVDGSCSPTL